MSAELSVTSWHSSKWLSVVAMETDQLSSHNFRKTLSKHKGQRTYRIWLTKTWHFTMSIKGVKTSNMSEPNTVHHFLSISCRFVAQMEKNTTTSVSWRRPGVRDKSTCWFRTRDPVQVGALILSDPMSLQCTEAPSPRIIVIDIPFLHSCHPSMGE